MTDPKDFKKFSLAAAAAYVGLNVMDYLLHGVILMPTYRMPKYASLWNPPAEMGSRRWASLIGTLLFSIVFAKIYAQGYEEERPHLGQGLRFGFWIGLLAGTGSFMEYMVYPVSLPLALAWFFGAVVQCVLVGAIVASIYQPS